MPRLRSNSSTSSQPAQQQGDGSSITNSSGSKKTLREKLKKIGPKKHHDHSPTSSRHPQVAQPGEYGDNIQRRSVSLGIERAPPMAPDLGSLHAATMQRTAGLVPTSISLSSPASGGDTVTPDRGRPATPRSRPSSPSRPRTGDVKRPASGVSQPALADPVLSKPPTLQDMRSHVTPVRPIEPTQRSEEAYSESSPPIMPGGQTPGSAGSLQPAGGHFASASSMATSSTAGGFLSSVLNVAHSVLGTQPHEDHSTPSKTTGDASFGDSHVLDAEKSAQDQTLSPPARSSTLPPGNGRVARIAEEISPNNSLEPTKNREMRSGSLMSRRRRESNASAIYGPHETTGQPQKITGFAVASNKRNREFHATFRSVPEGDYLLDDYGCALQKEILVHGRMYVSESHICFNSNIFGWVTNLVIAFNDIVSIEKRSTAGIFPNAIQLATRSAKHVFASFISRETTYELIISIWRLTHPAIQTTPHGVEIAPVEDESDDNSTNGSGDEDDEHSDSSVQDSDHEFAVEEDTMSRHSSSPMLTTTSPQRPAASEKGDGGDAPAADFPGPREHAPTEALGLGDTSKFPRALIDQTVDAPLGQVCQLLFGPDAAFMRDFLEQNQKLLDVKVAGLPEPGKGKSRKISYVKPLSGPIGPKQTRCLIDDTVDLYDFDKAVQVTTNTTSPDVPSGDAFVIKTRVCLMWAPRNGTRVVCHCNIEWSKSSWIKAPIEKASTSGQIDYWTQLVDAVRSEVSSGVKRKRTKKSTRPRGKSAADEEGQAPSTNANAAGDINAGPLSRFLGLLSHINLTVLLVVLLLGMMFTMFRMQRSIHALSRHGRLGGEGVPLASSDRWAREEGDLWQWLSSRTGAQSNTGERAPVTDLAGMQLQEAIEQERIRLAVLMQAAEIASKQSKGR
ncbi:hypothetical protein BCR37DRAFT_383065 [Protomyces lactucae-debilis]|uniref:VASt domain-containing protein n=1 Tax=Protomyces lactucae-debilis TaxID=2754530 RepID=A0A1Y2EZM2_PROLT|nr:uncharacterized protein BCR37DRAFT_383065 [Protomyces lactucae-debilis]ORY77049.1 hypothetical protein BCR37DRAFT_383065 [Protomyces lactucae-debilis]